MILQIARANINKSCYIYPYDDSRRRSSERLRAEDAKNMLETIEEKYIHTGFMDLAISRLKTSDA